MIGGNYVNPIQQAPPEHFERILDILSKDENVDLVAAEVPVSRMANDKEFFDDRIRIFREIQANSPKPIVAMATTGYPRLDPAVEEAMNKRFTQEGILSFPNFLSGAKALKKLVDYHTLNGYISN